MISRKLTQRHSKVYVLTAPRKPLVRTTMSFMKQHTKPYCLILMASGLMTFRKLQATDDQTTKTVWRVFYSTYSLVCFTLFTLVDVVYLHMLYLTFSSDVQVFTMWLQVIVFCVVGVKIGINLISVVFKTRLLSHFFDESARYETSVNFVPPECIRQPAGRYVLRVLQFLVFVGNVCISTYLAYDQIDYYVRHVIVRVVVKTACVAGDVIFYVYQMSDFIVLRPFLEVLLLYIRQQHNALRGLMVEGSGSSLFVKRDRKVEEIRLNLCAISLLKNQMNNIWRWSLMISGAVVLLLACVSIYTAFVEGFSTLQPLLGMLYCALSVLDLLDIAVLSQEMVNEMRSMRQGLQNAPMCFENEAYFAQISYLRDTIKPNEMALSGAGFFHLNLPLIVSLAGSVITYTVILVQTSESVSTATTVE
ncbi:uncharacterized protein LOC142768391 [Rhipicephalus microplus]|uniref:uncharacterized protein LOC142768391 n=1 Tax=Rhipicephalus microplus TaxID=6941 RepID=UPI003F6AB64C